MPNFVDAFHAACAEMRFFDIQLAVEGPKETQSVEYFLLLCQHALSSFFLFGDNSPIHVELRVLTLFVIHGLWLTRQCSTAGPEDACLRLPVTAWHVRQIRSLANLAVDRQWADVANVIMDLHDWNIFRVVPEVDTLCAVSLRHAHVLLNQSHPAGGSTKHAGVKVDVE